MSQQCTQCGKGLIPNAKSCMMCGAKVLNNHPTLGENIPSEKEFKNKDELLAWLEAAEKKRKNRWIPILFCIIASVILSVALMFWTKSGLFIILAAFFPFFWFTRNKK